MYIYAISLHKGEHWPTYYDYCTIFLLMFPLPLLDTSGEYHFIMIQISSHKEFRSIFISGAAMTKRFRCIFVKQNAVCKLKDFKFYMTKLVLDK